MKILFLLTLSILLLPSILFSDGSNSGNILIQSYSAKAQGMGETYTALSSSQGDLTSFQYNPAALASLAQKEGLVTYKNNVFGGGLEVFSYGSPMTWRRGKSRLGCFAGTFLYYSLGNMEFLTSAGTLVTVNAQKDFAFLFSYGFNLWPTLSLGLNGKVLNSEIAESYKATAFAADIGTILKVGPATSMGISVLNIGTGLKYDKATDSLPLTVRGGLAHELNLGRRHQFLGALDVIGRRKEPLRNSIGLEYKYEDSTLAFALRTGYRFNQDVGKLNFGFGIPYKKYKFDYSSQILGGIGLSHFFTLRYTF